MNFFRHAFILVTTLWVLAIITVMVSFFALWVQNTLEITYQMQEDVQAQIDMQSTQAHLLYLLSTQRYTYGGLTVPPAVDKPTTINNVNDLYEFDLNVSLIPTGNEIALDDRVYRGYGNVRFALQDEGGLININTAHETVLNRLLGLLGVETQLRNPLIAKLQDYTDLDDLHRINGAESYHYKQHDLPIPTNHLLRTPLETQRVLEWAGYSELWKDNKWGQIFTTAPASLPNFNTAPSLVLQAFYGFDIETSQRIITARQKLALFNVPMLLGTTGVDVEFLGFDVSELTFFPNSAVRLTLWHPNIQRMRQIHLQMTPLADQKMPWLIEYTLELPLLSTYTTVPLQDVSPPIFTATLSAQPQ